ncbi:DUF6263 family protein [Arachidicoccus terrestris]|uniref:DUF6263 family protein n=1 Tax=Arachidicoccus terrestris TaxID=2875539 RepID=UPI001CC78B41|nr:DUF6263 family protein [Arachidicoccus terrestris]UAY55108.1 hypothetical protein K9M52_17025 [Arachidicoccus terrestris]
MKLFLLCIGLSLSVFIALPAHAQDTIKAPTPDTAQPVITHPVTDSIGDSTAYKAIASNQDTLPAAGKTDSTQRTRQALPADQTHRNADEDSLPSGVPPTRKDSSDENVSDTFNNSDTGKIVDIFEEMQKAREQQDKSIKNEQAEEKKQETEGQIGLNEKKDSIHQNNKGAQEDGSIKTPPSTADSSDLMAANDTIDIIKKDTIQSIFTLPKPSVTPASDTEKIASEPVNVPNVPSGRPANNRVDSTDLEDIFEVTEDSSAQASQNEQPVRRVENKTDNKPGHSKDKESADNLPIDTLGISQDTTALNRQQENKQEPTQAKTSVQERPAEQLPDSAMRPKQGEEIQKFNGAISDNSITHQIADSLPQPQNTPFTELFQPYRAFDKETQISSTTSLTILQQNVDYKTSADFTTQYQRTGQKDGQFHFDVSVVRLNTEVETMGVQLKYDSNQKTDSTSTFAKPLFDIVGKKTYLEVDSTGKITEVDNTALGRQVNTVLSGLSLSGGDFEVGSNFGLLMSKSGPAEIGQQWSDSVNHGSNTRITTYTIQSILDGDMLVTISGNVSQSGVINSDGATFKTHFTGTQKGKMYVDQQTLLVKSRDITLDMKGTVDYNGQALPASAVSKIKEKVTAN